MVKNSSYNLKFSELSLILFSFQNNLYYLLNISFFNMSMQVTTEFFGIMVLLASGHSLRHWNILIAFSRLLIYVKGTLMQI